MTAQADDAVETAATVARALGPVSAIPLGEGRAYAVDGAQIAVFRLRSGAVRAISAVCPHRGGPLADGQADDAVVICPLHAHVFELATGACRTGQPPLTAYTVRVDDAGQVVVEIPAPAPGD
jgi:nitrite reductase (NADH) small subunit